MVPRRYLFASMFIAAMLILLAFVQAPKSIKDGGIFATKDSAMLCMDSFETVAEYRLQDGWAPRFQGTKDPDKDQAWPYVGGFGTPWEPASAYLADQGFAMNGPNKQSEVVIWKSMEWRHYRFNAPLVSARLDPIKSKLLLITLMVANNKFETRLIRLSDGQLLWSIESGPWSRFSWDGQAVIFGLYPIKNKAKLQLVTIQTTAIDLKEALNNLYNQSISFLSKNDSLKREQLIGNKNTLGVHVSIPWRSGARIWFPYKNKLWVSVGNVWSFWTLNENKWCCDATGLGELYAQPPIKMGLIAHDRKLNSIARKTSSLNQVNWKAVPTDLKKWPTYDPAWTWWSDDFASTAWGLQWGKISNLLEEHQREALVKENRSEWITVSRLRASVRGWLPIGPEVALREPYGAAWVWVGNKVLLKKLIPSSRLTSIHKAIRVN